MCRFWLNSWKHHFSHSFQWREYRIIHSRVVYWAHQNIVPQLIASDPKNGCKGEVRIDGPYGQVPVSLRGYTHEYSHVVLVAGGVGITPLITIAAELRSLRSMPQLIWVNVYDEPVHHWYVELSTGLVLFSIFQTFPEILSDLHSLAG